LPLAHHVDLHVAVLDELMVRRDGGAYRSKPATADLNRVGSRNHTGLPDVLADGVVQDGCSDAWLNVGGAAHKVALDRNAGSATQNLHVATGPLTTSYVLVLASWQLDTDQSFCTA
jgi:hypothetical protein